MFPFWEEGKQCQQCINIASTSSTSTSTSTIVYAGPVHATDFLDRTGPIFQLRLPAFEITQLDHFRPVATGCLRDTS